MARSDIGPRADPSLDRKSRDTYENHIVLCSNHHRIIDRDRDTYPLESLQRMKADHESEIAARGSAATISTTTPSIRALKELRTENSNVEVSYANIIHKPQTEDLVAAFELAGWQTNFNEVPLDSYPTGRYYRGIEVSGFNKLLVEAVAEVLVKAGWSAVETVVKPLEIPRDNAKHPWAQQKLYIRIGHAN